MKRHGQTTNSELYWDDNTLWGVASEFGGVEIEHTTFDHETLGSIAIFSAPARPIKAMNTKLKGQFLEPDISRGLLSATKTLTFQLHADVDVANPDGFDEDESYKLITYVRALCTKYKADDAKLGDGLGFEADLTVHYLMQRVHTDQTPIVEIDLFANKYEVGGVPVWKR